MERTQRVQSLADQVSNLLGQIADLYQDDTVMTLVVRSLNSPDGSRDTCVTNDPDVEAAVIALRSLWRDPTSEETIAGAVKRGLQS